MSDRRPAPGGGLSPQTLVISSASAVIATVVVSQFWEAGTLFFTAFVPVTIAVVSEVLKRPAEKITEVAPFVAPRAVSRRRSGQTGGREPAMPDDAPTPMAALPGGAKEDPFGLYAPDNRSVLSGRTVRIGLLTGLLAFLIAAAVITVSELALFDNSIGNGDRRTTLVGGSSKSSRTDAKETPTPSPDVTPGATPSVTPTATATPDRDATPSPTPRVSPTPTPTPTPTPGATPTPTPTTPGGAARP